MIIWFVVIAGLFAWASLRRQEQDTQKRAAAKISTPKQEVESTESQVKIDSAPPFPTKQLAKPAQAGPIYDIQNLSLDDQSLAEKWQGQEEILIKELLVDSKRLRQCLQKDLCGEKPNANSPYFDIHNTPSHGLLERELSALVFLQEAEKLESDMIPKLEMEEMLAIENEAVQRMALELRLAAGIDDAAYERLIKRTPSLLPQASANALAQLSKESRLSQSRRDQLIKAAESLFNADDQSKAIEMAKRIKYIDVDKAELEQLAATTCHLLPQNRKAVQYHLGVAAEGVGANLQFKCQ